MLSKKSKIEQLPKSRKSRFLVASAAASLSRTRTKLCGRSLVIRRGPSHRRARNAPAVLKNFFPRQKNLFRQYRSCVDIQEGSNRPALMARNLTAAFVVFSLAACSDMSPKSRDRLDGGLHLFSRDQARALELRLRVGKSFPRVQQLVGAA